MADETMRSLIALTKQHVRSEFPFNWDNAMCARCGHPNNPVMVDYPHKDLRGHPFEAKPEDVEKASTIQLGIDRILEGLDNLLRSDPAQPPALGPGGKTTTHGPVPPSY